MAIGKDNYINAIKSNINELSDIRRLVYQDIKKSKSALKSLHLIDYTISNLSLLAKYEQKRIIEDAKAEAKLKQKPNENN